MARILALFNAAFILGLMACARPPITTAIDRPRTDLVWVRATGWPGAAPDTLARRYAGGRQYVRPSAVQIPPSPLPGPQPALSSSVRQVSQIADRNGDQIYLIVDKIHGKVALFENGAAIFVGAALTGQSMADFLPPDAVGKFYSQQIGVKYKVTPAGRFTVSRGYDPRYGDLLDLNEIQGKDWAIAIHRVFLGVPSQRRDARLQSPNDEDKHITDGCIDVESSTMRQLLRLLAKQDAVPIYILPSDETLITKLFPPRVTASNALSPAG